MSTSETHRLAVRGKVQGVGFRYFVRQAAEELDLQGWVRNRPDGTVEAVVVGCVESLEALRRQVGSGPPAAVVEGVEWTVLSESPAIEGFRIAYG